VNKQARFIAPLLVVMLLSVSSLSAQANRICFAFQDVSTEFWVASHMAIIGTLNDAGFEVTELNGGQDANRQLEQIRDCIAQGVDGIILIAQDGESGNTIINEAQENDVPIATFNRPPADPSEGIVVVADNESVAQQAVEFMAQKALGRFEGTGEKINPLILVGDLADPNAVARRQGFINVIEKYPDLFNAPVELATEWNADKAQAQLEEAITANPNIDFIFASSDFMFPLIRSVLDAHGKWIPAGQQGHVILGGLDGDATACQLIKEGYVDATGVQDLYYEAQLTTEHLLAAIESGDTAPNAVLQDPGFALTSGNIDFQEMDSWGCVLLSEGFLDQ
jgi:ABC-type sugar transport system substrate-binding protein